MTHPYKNILIAIANGEQVQWRDEDGGWHDQSTDCTLREISSRRWPPEDFRIKPKTITINGHEVPEPVRKPLGMGQKYWLAAPTSSEGVSEWFWSSGPAERRWLELGMIHLDESAASLHSEALLSFTKRGEK